MSLALAPELQSKPLTDLGGPYHSTFVEKKSLYAKKQSDLTQMETDEKGYRSWVSAIQDDIHGQYENFKRLKLEYDRLASRLEADAERVVVLIDGDGCIFSADRVNRGSKGGMEAADKLCSLVFNKTGVREEHQHVFIYFNKRKLADTMSTNWNVRQDVMRGRLDSFVRGFNGRYPNFNIIDAGGEKQAADMKLLVFLKSETFLPRTKHVVFGGCHDKGYAATLQSLIDAGFKQRLTLLLGYDERMLPDYQRLNLGTLENEGLFISRRLPLSPANDFNSVSTYATSRFRPPYETSTTNHRRHSSNRSFHSVNDAPLSSGRTSVKYHRHSTSFTPMDRTPSKGFYERDSSYRGFSGGQGGLQPLEEIRDNHLDSGRDWNPRLPPPRMRQDSGSVFDY